jgi:hypothetical protein
MTCGALGLALALGGLALGRGLLSAITRILARSPLVEPACARSLSLRPLLLNDLLTLISQTLAPIRDLFTHIGDPLSLIRDPVTLIRDLLAPFRPPLALIGHPRHHPRLSLLPTLLAAQPGTLALQHLIIGVELRRAALDLRADALNLDGSNTIILAQRADAQLVQIVPVGLEACPLTLQLGAAPLKLSPLRIAPLLPHRGRRFMTCRALLMHEPRPNVHSSVPAGAD